MRNLAGQATINPSTANTHGLVGGEKANVRTQGGSKQVRVHLDPSVVEGVIQVTVGPHPNGGEDLPRTEGVLSLCTLSDEGTWRVTSATIEKV